MTTIILRPDAKIPHRRHVSTLATDGTERALGWVQFAETHWTSHKSTRSKTREEAVRKLAEECCLPGPYRVEELAARVRRQRVQRCGWGCIRRVEVTVRLECAR